MIDFSRFQKALPAQVLELLDFFNQNGFKAGIVGGIPRDYVNQMSVGDDFDVELRPVEEKDFLERFKFMALSLESRHEIREKGYSVYEVVFDKCSVEFSLPRIEIFKNKVHHSNFKAKYIPDASYSEGFKRRDFTVNAIMFERWEGEWRLRDPLEGVKDIKNTVLRPCDNQSFVKDPVRFLRAVRFELKLGFNFDLNLTTLVKNMELAPSLHYLKTEALKSQMPLCFLYKCFELRPNHFSFEFLAPFQEQIKRYEESVKALDLREHVGAALFLPMKIRSQALKRLGEKDKGLIDLNLKEVNLGLALSKTLSDLNRMNWVAGLLALLHKSPELNKERLRWILKEEGSEFDIDFIEKYNQLSALPDSNVPNHLKRFDVFKKKLELIAQK
ncbi:MAG: hypothetical protein WD025_06590 [Bacteriovoracaceae bacterium]